MSICIYCGQKHDPALRVCPKTGRTIGNAEAAQKTLFGMPSAFAVPTPGPAPKSELTPRAVSLPLPKPLGPPTSATTVAKTAYGSPTLPQPARVTPTLSSSTPRPSPNARSSASPSVRLPTEQEARDNPELVITLELTPPPSVTKSGAPPAAAKSSTRAQAPSPPPATVKAAPQTRVAAAKTTPTPQPPLQAPGPVAAPSRAAAPSEMVPPSGLELAPDESPPPVDLPSNDSVSAAPESPSEVPTDLPPPGMGPRFVLPQPKSADGQAGSEHEGGGHLAADARSIVELLTWALLSYLRRPKVYLVIVAFLVLPASILESCLVTGIAPGPASLARSALAVDFSARKAELATRIQSSQARGQTDNQAVAELAALTSVETSHIPLPDGQSHETSTWLRAALGFLVLGLVLFGLAFPLAFGALAIVAVDEQSGSPVPGFAEIWPILLSRGELLILSLVPAAACIAAGHALFVLPGLVVSVLFLFVPHVVLFEKSGGRAALSRSIELFRKDARRVALAYLTFALAGFLIAVLAHWLLPPEGSRAVVFLHFAIRDAAVIMILPVPALVLARLYMDLRKRTGASPQRLSQAVRT